MFALCKLLNLCDLLQQYNRLFHNGFVSPPAVIAVLGSKISLSQFDVSVRVQSQSQNHCTSWDKDFIIGVRPYLVMGGAGKVEESKKKSSTHQFEKPSTTTCQERLQGREAMLCATTTTSVVSYYASGGQLEPLLVSRVFSQEDVAESEDELELPAHLCV